MRDNHTMNVDLVKFGLIFIGGTVVSGILLWVGGWLAIIPAGLIFGGLVWVIIKVIYGEYVTRQRSKDLR